MTFGGQLGLYPLVSDTLFRSKGAFSYSILFSAFTISDILILGVMKHVTSHYLKGDQNVFMRVLSVIAILPLAWIWIINRKIKGISKKNKI
jgi:hypothetical protein